MLSQKEIERIVEPLVEFRGTGEEFQKTYETIFYSMDNIDDQRRAQFYLDGIYCQRLKNELADILAEAREADAETVEIDTDALALAIAFMKP